MLMKKCFLLSLVEGFLFLPVLLCFTELVMPIMFEYVNSELANYLDFFCKYLFDEKLI